MTRLVRSLLLLIMAMPTLCGVAGAWNPGSLQADGPGVAGLLHELRLAVEQRDERRILDLVHPQCVVSYGGFRGPDDFRQHWLPPHATKGRDIFAILERALEIGGAMTRDGDYVLPYTALAPGVDSDGVLLGVVLPPMANVRAWPGLKGRPVGSLDRNTLVRLCNIEVPVPVDGMEWVCVLLEDGTRGYVAEHLLSLPTEPRFRFRCEQGRWWLVSTVAGE